MESETKNPVSPVVGDERTVVRRMTTTDFTDGGSRRSRYVEVIILKSLRLTFEWYRELGETYVLLKKEVSCQERGSKTSTENVQTEGHDNT